MNKKLVIIFALIFGVILLLCCCCMGFFLTIDSMNPKEAKLNIDHEYGVIAPPFKTEKEYFNKTVNRDRQDIKIDVEKGGDLALEVEDLSDGYVEFSTRGWAIVEGNASARDIKAANCGQKNTFKVKRGEGVKLYTCSLGSVDIWSLKVEK